ncbi:hypothetical protein N566_06800 [Streptomycetaceae bacterium MP113-05]|nr:hypothetical protein N566_06800 [Streptomycetaceae bacterium MP113-05]
MPPYAHRAPATLPRLDWTPRDLKDVVRARFAYPDRVLPGCSSDVNGGLVDAQW